MEIKNNLLFPADLGFGRKGLRLCFCQAPDLCHLSAISLTIEIRLSAHYSNLFSALNFEILFIITPLPSCLIYFVS